MSAENGEDARVFTPTAIAHDPRTSHPSPLKSLPSSRLCGAIPIPLIKTELLSLALVAFLAAPFPAWAAAKGQPMTIPDFTKGDTITAGAKHDWNLGAIGTRGWMFCDRMVTSDARQVAITKVEKGSPADGILAVGDVLLGVGGKPFSYDPRTELGQALSAAESDAGGGKLALTRWRAGKSEEVVVKLAVLGSYSATAPYDCPKSKRILEQGCKLLAAQIAEPAYAEKQDPITRSLNALALLASGEPAYLPLVKKEAQWAADFSAASFQTWYYGYVIMLLSEYVIATGDASVMPGLKRLALASANGQSAVGSWGHRFAIPDGRLGGYGMMNSPGVPLTTGLVLARTAGVKDAAVDRAIERSARLLRFYIGKGAIPYGDHAPWTETHEDNGKCGMTAVLFSLIGEAKGAEFFSRLSVASHSAERDTGHTGNFFNMLWAMPGIAQSGPQATGAWMQEFGGWYFDFARRWDGSFLHQGPPETGHDSYAGWDCTGAYLLAYAMPLRKIHLTGKRPAITPQLDTAAAQSLIFDGRGWSNKDRKSAYDAFSEEELLARLGSWSPTIRERAAMTFARRKSAPIPALLKMLDAPSLETRYGACQALGLLKGTAAAVPALQKLLRHEDLWLRVQAAEALAAIGQPAMVALPELLERLAREPSAQDPRGMEQRYLCSALFGTLLNKSLDGVDHDLLRKAVVAGLRNQDGRARGEVGGIYGKLSYDELKPLLPAILEAIVTPAPSGEMFADSIRVEGLRLLAKHRIEEGISACVKYTRDQNPWASQERTPKLMKILLTYGTHAKSVIPELTRLADYFEKDEKDFPKNLMLVKAKSIRETIAAIEASTDTPELIRLK